MRENDSFTGEKCVDSYCLLIQNDRNLVLSKGDSVLGGAHQNFEALILESGHTAFMLYMQEDGNLCIQEESLRSNTGEKYFCFGSLKGSNPRLVVEAAELKVKTDESSHVLIKFQEDIPTPDPTDDPIKYAEGKGDCDNSQECANGLICVNKDGLREEQDSKDNGFTFIVSESDKLEHGSQLGDETCQSPNPKRHLVVWQENPSSEVLINWGLDYDAKGEHKVYLSKTPIGPKSDSLQFAAKESGMRASCDNKYIHSNFQAKITKLEPNTKYYFVTESNGKRSAELYFITAPAPTDTDVAFKLLSGGDSRTDRVQRRNMNQIMSSMVKNDPSYLALVHGGDFITNGADCDQWLGWRDDHQSSNLEDGRVIPVIATFGNHEQGGEKQYLSLFGDPLRRQVEDDPMFYFVSTLGNMSLIVLNSEISVIGTQQTWLQNTLEDLKTKEDHVIVAGYHRPAWPAQKTPASTTAWIDEFEAYQVNLVLESDGHVLKQTCPIYEGACNNENGIVYVGEGGLGVTQRTPRTDDQIIDLLGFNPFAAVSGGYKSSQHHVQSLAISGAKPSVLTYKVYYNDTYNHIIELPSKDRSQLGSN